MNDADLLAHGFGPYFQTSIKSNLLNFFYIILLNMNFENLITYFFMFLTCMLIGFYFTIRLINLFFTDNFYHKNLKFKRVIDDIAVDLLSS